MELIDNIRLLKRLASVIGLAPLFSEPFSTVNMWKLILQLFYICVLSIPCVYQCVKIYFILIADRKPELAEFVSLLEISFLTVNVFVAWFHSLVYYKKLMTIISAFYKLEKLYSILHIHMSHNDDGTIKIVQIVSFITLVLVLNVLEFLENGYNWGYLIVLPIALAFFFQFVNFIICINYCFVTINTYLCQYASNSDDLSTINESISNFTSHCNILDNHCYIGLYSKWRISNHKVISTSCGKVDCISNIKIAREIHRFLYSLCKEINSFFAIQILLCLISKIISITIVLYYLLSSTKVEDLNLDRPDYWIPRLNKLIICTSNFLQLVIIAFVCTTTSEEANFTSILVHGLLNGNQHKGLQNDLRIFSQQLLHQRITFTAAGFVVLDFTLINAVISAVTTYLVILIQFQMST